MDDCVFCKIIDGQLPSMKIDEDERTLTFMDIHPLSSGHCLVVPKHHAATIFEADVRDLEAAMVTAKRVALAIQEALRPDGLNVLQANGADAFQSVPHFHHPCAGRTTARASTGRWRQSRGDQEDGRRIRSALNRRRRWPSASAWWCAGLDGHDRKRRSSRGRSDAGFG